MAMQRSVPWTGKQAPTEEQIRQQWQHLLIGGDKLNPHSALATGLEWYVGKALMLCPVGSRISLNVEPGIILSCKKETATKPLVMRWLITEEATRGE